MSFLSRKNPIVSAISSFILVACITFALLELSFFLILKINPMFRLNFPAPKDEIIHSRIEIPESLSAIPLVSNRKTKVTALSDSVISDFPYELDGDVWVPPKNKDFQIPYKSIKTGKVVWISNISTDASRRRKNSYDHLKINPKLHIFGFGCSNAWGLGLNDDETVLAQISKRNSSVITYNGAFEGYGPAENLMRAEKTNLLEGIQPKSGIGIYFYTNDHFSRFVNSSRTIATWREKGLELHETEVGKFESLGQVMLARPYWLKFSRALLHDPIATVFGIDLPPENTKDLDRMLRAIKETRQFYWNHTQQSNPFVVVLLPISGAASNRLIKSLIKAEIPFINYSTIDVAARLEGSEMLPGDSHRTKEFYEKISIALERDLLKAANPR